MAVHADRALAVLREPAARERPGRRGAAGRSAGGQLAQHSEGAIGVDRHPGLALDHLGDAAVGADHERPAPRRQGAEGGRTP